MEVAKKELETKFENDMINVVAEHEEKVQQMSLAHAKELLECQKKLEEAEKQ